MNTRPFRLLKPLRVVPLGLENKTRRNELPYGAEVRILRESVGDDCIDLAYKNERYFTLRNELVSGLDQRLAFRPPLRKKVNRT